MNKFPCLMMIGCINPRSINPYVLCRFFTSIYQSSSVSSHQFGCQSFVKHFLSVEMGFVTQMVSLCEKEPPAIKKSKIGKGNIGGFKALESFPAKA
ncbi:hypothetical protein HanIR_Chr16g0795441 [Helianthus annuus]|nr:hypothetical protein HanIR_Chr16g0795441 [Helianthus annuus]